MTSRGPPSGIERLSERAASLGIETQYRDAWGLQRNAEPEALACVIAALGRDHQPTRLLLPRIIVARHGHSRRVPLNTDTPALVQWEIDANGMIVGGEGTSAAIELPADLPPGTYGLKVAARFSGQERIEEATLLSAPARAFQRSGNWPGRLWALAVQLYGVRSRRNWGHGDFTDLGGLLALAAELGGAGVALNPLHVLFDDRAEAASPYSPNSRLFINPLYIDIEAIPEFPGLVASGLEAEVAQLRQRDLVDYAGVASAKNRGLRLCYEVFRRPDNDRRQEFEGFRRERGQSLARFACFEFLRRRFGKPWREWPEPWRNPTEDALADLRASDGEAIVFFEFVQWVAELQLQACCRRARELALPIGLYLDVAVGVQPEGFDAWSDQNSIMSGLAIGAPPDLYNMAGQNWGLAAFNPVALELQQLQPFRQMLQASMRHAGAIRLDHVLGLKRLFLIPDGMRPDQGVYLCFPLEALLAVAAQESVRHQCVVVGEDLGTVPDGFRDTLADWGIWSYQVMLFERAPDGSFLPPESYRREALVTFSTHDLATFTGWMCGHDLAVKRALNMDPGETDAQRAAAHRKLRSALSLGAGAPDFPAVARFLAQTPARLLVIAIEDALGVRDQANIPATIDEHPNWRRRLPVQLEDLNLQVGLTAVAEVMASAGRGIRRTRSD
jgi:4-alpha-glucanotransferase